MKCAKIVYLMINHFSCLATLWLNIFELQKKCVRVVVLYLIFYSKLKREGNDDDRQIYDLIALKCFFVLFFSLIEERIGKPKKKLFLTLPAIINQLGVCFKIVWSIRSPTRALLFLFKNPFVLLFNSNNNNNIVVVNQGRKFSYAARHLFYFNF